MVVLRKIWYVLFCCNTRFEIRPFALLPTCYSMKWNCEEIFMAGKRIRKKTRLIAMGKTLKETDKNRRIKLAQWETQLKTIHRSTPNLNWKESEKIKINFYKGLTYYVLWLQLFWLNCGWIVAEFCDTNFLYVYLINILIPIWNKFVERTFETIFKSLLLT